MRVCIHDKGQLLDVIIPPEAVPRHVVLRQLVAVDPTVGLAELLIVRNFITITDDFRIKCPRIRLAYVQAVRPVNGLRINPNCSRDAGYTDRDEHVKEHYLTTDTTAIHLRIYTVGTVVQSAGRYELD